MENVLIITGLACIVAAIIGGGLKFFNIEIPLLNSIPRQIILGVVGFILIIKPLIIPISGDLFRWLGHETLPQKEVVRIEEGGELKIILNPLQKSVIMAIKLYDDQKYIGVINLDYHSNNNIFKIKSVQNDNKQSISEYINATHGDTKTTLQNWDTVEMIFKDHKYALRIGYTSGIIKAWFRKVY
jgi:hypothetical protein